MRVMRQGILATFLMTISFATNPARKAPSIEKFKHEAERLIGRPIVLVEVPESSLEDGQTTYDNPAYVQISLRGGMPADLRVNVLAHELGHVVLKARNITSVPRAIVNVMQGNQGLIDAAGDIIGNCYIDPSADAEAAKHGFKPETVVDAEESRLVKRSTPDQIRRNLSGDQRFPNYAALYMYCLSLRPHTFDLDDLRRVFINVEPAVDKKFWDLRKLGDAKCSTPQNCFEKTKRLRDAAGFSGLIGLKNPNGDFE